MTTALQENTATFPRHPGEELRVWAEPYKGQEYVHARTFYDPGDGAGFRPTKKGVTLPPEIAAQVALAMLRAAGVTTAEEIAEALAFLGASASDGGEEGN